MSTGPTVVDTGGAPLGAFAAAEGDALRAAVREHGAVLLRGSAPAPAAEFANLAGGLATTLMPEREGFATRTAHPGCVYSAAHWPTDQPMCAHHERSYGAFAPRLLVIGCHTAPERGGQTGLAGSAAVLGALATGLVERFARTGWILERHYGDLVGVSLTDAFGTEDRAGIEEYCRDNDIEYTWFADGTLHTRQHRPAVLTHPDTGRRCWFNQVAFLNEWTMESAVREYLVENFGAERLPFNTRYGDGSAIEPETVAAINETYEAHTHLHAWTAGEVLLVDNIAVATSRQPCSGTRELLVALADPFPAGSVTPVAAG